MKIDSYIKEQFGIKDVDIRTYSPLTLAYIGDGIFDIVIRSVVVGKGNTKANLLHKHTSNIVKAHTQALMRVMCITGDAMPSRLPWQKMLQWLITGKLQGLRRSWAIFI